MYYVLKANGHRAQVDAREVTVDDDVEDKDEDEDDQCIAPEDSDMEDCTSVHDTVSLLLGWLQA